MKKREKLKRIINLASSSIYSNNPRGTTNKQIGGGLPTQVISNENTDMNGDGKSDDCEYDDDPTKDTIPSSIAMG